MCVGVPGESERTTPARDWYALACDDAAAALETSVARGLSSAEGARRLAWDGPNAIAAARGRGAIRTFVAQFTDVLVLVLLGAAVVAGLLGEPKDAVAILAIVVLDGMLGFVQEYRAERAMAALQAMAAPNARVRR